MRIQNVFFILIISFLSVHNLFSQNVKRITSEIDGNVIIINYEISGARFNQSFDVSLYISTDGGNNFTNKIAGASGDIGPGIKGGKHSIIWSPFNDVASLDNGVIFDIRATVTDSLVKNHFFIHYSAGALLNNVNYITPFGIQIGKLGKLGWYMSARLNSLGQAKYNYNGEVITDYQNQNNYYEFDDKVKYPLLTITAGATWQLNWNWFIYGGAGYGARQLLWHINEYSYNNDQLMSNNYVEHEEYTSKGLEMEVGMIFQANVLSFSVGASLLDFKNPGLHIGLGYNF